MIFLLLPLAHKSSPMTRFLTAPIPADAVNERAESRYPVQSLVAEPPLDPTLRGVFTQAAQHQFKTRLAAIDHCIIAKLDQPFGKENLAQCFYSEPSLRHILLPLWKSGMLAGDVTSWDAFSAAYYPVTVLRDLLEDYGDVPFSGIRGYSTTWSTDTSIDEHRVAMATAAVLHYNGSAADMIR